MDWGDDFYDYDWLEGVITGGGSIVANLAAMRYIHENLVDIGVLRQIDIFVRALSAANGRGNAPAPPPGDNRFFGDIGSLWGEPWELPEDNLLLLISLFGGNQPASDSLHIVPREVWQRGLPSPHIPDFPLFGENIIITTIVVHHTASPPTSDPWRGSDIYPWFRTPSEQRVINHDNDHRSWGWEGMGYHFLIGYDGTIYQGRDIIFEGRHAREGASIDRNPTSIGIAFMGTFSQDNAPDPRQIDSMHRLIDHITNEIPTIERVEVHRQGYGYLGPWFHGMLPTLNDNLQAGSQSGTSTNDTITPQNRPSMGTWLPNTQDIYR